MHDDEYYSTVVCCHCHKVGTIGRDLIQVGTSDFDRRWIHDCCWEEWYTKRLTQLNV